MDKVIIDQDGQGSGVVPYLPLNELQRRSAPPGGSSQPQQQQGAVR
jgi:membrane protease subunit HflK